MTQEQQVNLGEEQDPDVERILVLADAVELHSLGTAEDLRAAAAKIASRLTPPAAGEISQASREAQAAGFCGRQSLTNPDVVCTRPPGHEMNLTPCHALGAWSERLEAVAESARVNMEKNASRLDRITGYAAKHGNDVSAIKALAGVAEDLAVSAVAIGAAVATARAAATAGGAHA